LNRQRALDAVAASGGKLRALDESFTEVVQAFAAEKGDPEKLAYLEKFIAGLRANGFIQQSIDRAKLSGVGVATSIPRPR
jgi:hypothetical protein